MSVMGHQIVMTARMKSIVQVCFPNLFACKTSQSSKTQCIWDVYVCDGSSDCEDGSDEVNCTGIFPNLFACISHHRAPRHSVSGTCMSAMGHQTVKMAQMKSTVQVCF